MSISYTYVGVRHFIDPDFFLAIMPNYLPYHLEFVYLSGIAEISFGILLLFWLIDWSASFAGPTAAKILQYVSFIEHLEDFQRGVIDSRDIVFYVSFTFFCLFLTTRVVESRRWRR